MNDLKRSGDMSAKREHLRRLQERILERSREMYRFSIWLAEEPPLRHWRKWHRWKKRRPEIMK